MRVSCEVEGPDSSTNSNTQFLQVIQEACMLVQYQVVTEMKGDHQMRPYALYTSHWRQMATDGAGGGEAKPDEDVAPRQSRRKA